MHLKAKIYQHRRDFRGIFACYFCGHEEEGPGYDDAYFHRTVIPGMKCKSCGKQGGGTSTEPTVPAGVVI